MKTAKLNIEKRAISLLLFICMLAVTLLVSCESQEDPSFEDAEDNQVAELESMDEFYEEDADDFTLTALESAEELSGGKSAGDPRLSCAVVTRTGDENSGTTTIDFGSGCTDARGNVRRGSIVVEFSGRWSRPGSAWVIRFVNYFINDVKVEGKRSVKNVSESENGLRVFEIDVEDGVMTFPDGTVAKRKLHRRREHERDENNILKRLIIYGTVEGNHRNGRGFYIEILEPLVYDRSCEDVIIPVSGKKLIKHGAREITVDYGDGTCDNVVMITNKNGKSWRYDVGK